MSDATIESLRSATLFPLEPVDALWLVLYLCKVRSGLSDHFFTWSNCPISFGNV